MSLFVTALRHRATYPSADVPRWASKVQRWQQLDPCSFVAADAWDTWMSDASAPMHLLLPKTLVIATPRASNHADLLFAQTGAFSPSRFVATLPSMTLSAMMQMTGWTGPLFCFQDGASTLHKALHESLLLARDSSQLPLGIAIFRLMDGEGRDLPSRSVRIDVLLINDRDAADSSEFLLEEGLTSDHDPYLHLLADDILAWIEKPQSTPKVTLGPKLSLVARKA